MGFDDISRGEFLRTVARSRVMRALPWFGAVILLILIAPSLWPIRYEAAAIAAIVAAVFASYVANYWFASEKRRRKIDEKIRLDKLHWSYGVRWWMWVGLAMAAGQLYASWSTGRDLSIPLTISGLLFTIGAIAQIVWAVWSARHLPKSCAGNSATAADR